MNPQLDIFVHVELAVERPPQPEEAERHGEESLVLVGSSRYQVTPGAAAAASWSGNQIGWRSSRMQTRLRRAAQPNYSRERRHRRAAVEELLLHRPPGIDG